MQSVAAVMEQRGERYRERMADISEKVAGHLDSLKMDEILLRSAQVEKSIPLHVGFLAWTVQQQAAARST